MICFEKQSLLEDEKGKQDKSSISWDTQDY